MSIDDTSLPAMLQQLAMGIETLHRMQDWAEANSDFNGSSLMTEWGYGQYDTGFADIRNGVQAIVRERFVEVLQETIDRKEKEVAELHERVRSRMSRFAADEEAAPVTDALRQGEAA